MKHVLRVRGDDGYGMENGIMLIMSLLMDPEEHSPSILSPLLHTLKFPTYFACEESRLSYPVPSPFCLFFYKTKKKNLS